jgi:hypothetical protein
MKVSPGTQGDLACGGYSLQAKNKNGHLSSMFLRWRLTVPVVVSHKEFSWLPYKNQRYSLIYRLATVKLVPPLIVFYVTKTV